MPDIFLICFRKALGLNIPVLAHQSQIQNGVVKELIGRKGIDSVDL